MFTIRAALEHLNQKDRMKAIEAIDAILHGDKAAAFQACQGMSRKGRAIFAVAMTKEDET